MSLTLYNSPATGMLKQLNLSGQVYAGCLLWIYSAGTTTLLDTYTDSSGKVKNANPIIYDSAGQLSTSIWVPKTTYHKAFLTDPNGNQLYAVDNLVGINDPYTTNANFNPSNSIGEVSGTFSCALFGLSGVSNVSMYYVVHKNTATITLQPFSGIANAPVLRLTILPSFIIPVTAKMTSVFWFKKDSTYGSGNLQVTTSSNGFSFYYNGSPAFTALHTYSLPFTTTLSYDLS